jgi:ribosomal protein S18 acetylase RimI-like enzyme
MDIAPVTQVTDEVVEAMVRLVPQLSSSAPPPTRTELAAIVDSDCSTILVARDPAQDGAIVGTLTLVLFRTPTAVRAWIEDVVVDAAARRRGIGAALTRAAIALATEYGATKIDLTSRPSREAANRLYRRLGFQQRDTNIYRYTP